MDNQQTNNFDELDKYVKIEKVGEGTYGGRAAPLRSKNFLRSWSKYSNIRYSFFSPWTSSLRLTIFGCFNCFKILISRIAVLGIPSSSFSNFIFLSATNSCVSLFLDLYTTPYVPSPTFSIFIYLFKFELN